MVLVKTRKVGRTLYGCVPEYIEAASYSACEGSKITELCLTSLAQERTACALLVEVHTHFFCIPHATLYTASHLATGKICSKTSTVLYTAVDVVQLVTKKFPCCFGRDACILHAHILLDELLLLLDVLNYGVACLTTIHHELVESSLHFVVHVKCSAVVLLQ